MKFPNIKIVFILLLIIISIGVFVFVFNLYHYPKGYNPVQIVSVKVIPDDPHVNDLLDFNVTFQNLGYPPIYYIGGCGPEMTYFILSNNTKTIGASGCMCPIEPTAKSLSQNEAVSAVTSFCTSDRQLVTKPGQYVANVTVHWSTKPSMYLENSTFTLFKLNITK
ncbi:MAG: hypothetical protein PXX83_09530 [Candidatus Nitrosotalea sp.]|nr:hypothetical protein [Candidatus Nitrosotalea sp.]